jgi:hypothetical protein
MLNIPNENKDVEIFKNEFKLYLLENKVSMNYYPCTYWKENKKNTLNYQI